jgi:hypothetical protein
MDEQGCRAQEDTDADNILKRGLKRTGGDRRVKAQAPGSERNDGPDEAGDVDGGEHADRDHQAERPLAVPQAADNAECQPRDRAEDL